MAGETQIPAPAGRFKASSFSVCMATMAGSVPETHFYRTENPDGIEKMVGDFMEGLIG